VEKERKAKGIVLVVAARTMASFARGAAETAPLTTHCRRVGVVEAAALTTVTTVSGFAAMAALTMRLTIAQSAPGLSSEFLTAALTARVTILEVSSGRRLIPAMT
jgi:hypothetical protein